MKNIRLYFVFASSLFWLTGIGCASIRDMKWEAKAEKTQYQPQEQRREELEYLAQPK